MSTRCPCSLCRCAYQVTSALYDVHVAVMAFDLLPALRPRRWRSAIYVRVCRKWEYRGGTINDGPIQHVDLVLLDEKVCISVYFFFFSSIVADFLPLASALFASPSCPLALI